MKSGRSAIRGLQYSTVAFRLSSLLGLAACGTTLQPVNPEETTQLLPARHVQLIREACTTSYEDRSRRLLVYRIDFSDQSAVCDINGPYELVLILDRDDRVERHRLLRVK
jgi:hypothetical protein